MKAINSYPNVFQIGHKSILDIFISDVIVEEKIDGSQFSFGLIEGELVCRSKGKQQFLDAPDDLFKKAVEIIKTLDLHPEWVYRGEYLAKPKHNTLAYSRIPAKHIILYDINTGLESYMSYEEKQAEAARLGLECVPIMFSGKVKDFEMFKSFLDYGSVLGGCRIEGVVVKNYNLFTKDKKAMMGKYVSESFKEKHEGDWKERNPNTKDIEALLIEQYRTDARWHKAVQHLRDEGKLEQSPRDIPLLLKEVSLDILKDSEDEIKDKLFKHFWSKINRGVVRGLPEWYKELLAKESFDVES